MPNLTIAAPAEAERHTTTTDALAVLAGNVAPAELDAHVAHAAGCPHCAELLGVVVELGVQAVATASAEAAS